MTAPNWPLITAAAGFGLLWGSFLNVLIHRLPRDENVVRGRSRCPGCRTVIAWYDNIPVLSYLLLRGRCRKCRMRIGLRYPAVELLSAGIAVAVSIANGVTLEAAWVFVFVTMLLVITLIDWAHQIIPDELSIGGTVFGWVGSVVCLDISLVDSLVGSFVGGGTLLAVAIAYKAVRRADGMGGGDVKLMAMIGAFLGWQMTFLVFFFGSFAGALYGAYLMTRGGTGKTAVAFGSFLAPAATLVLVFGHDILRLYAEFVRG